MIRIKDLPGIHRPQFLNALRPDSFHEFYAAFFHFAKRERIHKSPVNIAAFYGDSLCQAVHQRRGQDRTDCRASARLAGDRDPLRIPAERRDIVFHPLAGHAHIM